MQFDEHIFQMGENHQLFFFRDKSPVKKAFDSRVGEGKRCCHAFLDFFFAVKKMHTLGP